MDISLRCPICGINLKINGETRSGANIIVVEHGLPRHAILVNILSGSTIRVKPIGNIFYDGDIKIKDILSIIDIKILSRMIAYYMDGFDLRIVHDEYLSYIIRKIIMKFPRKRSNMKIVEFNFIKRNFPSKHKNEERINKFLRKIIEDNSSKTNYSNLFREIEMNT